MAICFEKFMNAPRDERIERFSAKFWQKADGGILLILDRERRIVAASPGIKNVIGYEQGELVGKMFDDLIVDHIERFAEALTSIKDDDHGMKKLDLGIVSKDGRRMMFRTELFSLDNDGEVGINAWDISSRIDVERSLDIMNKKLSILGSATRHDVLNSLTGLFGYLELAEVKCKDDAVRKYISKAKQSAETVREQMEFTRYYQDIGLKRPVWVGIEDSVKTAFMAVNDSRLSLDVKVGGLRVHADPMLDKVFYNLMDNVHRHSNATSVKVYFEEEGDRGILTFEDNGVGIPDDEKDIIFARGYGKNTGLGLYLVREVLDITEITIKETGEPGRGAKFVLSIPQSRYKLQ